MYKCQILVDHRVTIMIEITYVFNVISIIPIT